MRFIYSTIILYVVGFFLAYYIGKYRMRLSEKKAFKKYLGMFKEETIYILFSIPSWFIIFYVLYQEIKIWFLVQTAKRLLRKVSPESYEELKKELKKHKEKKK